MRIEPSVTATTAKTPHVLDANEPQGTKYCIPLWGNQVELPDDGSNRKRSTKLCSCGCGKRLRADNRTGFYISLKHGHDHKHGLIPPMWPCACGCGDMVGSDGGFAVSHWPRTQGQRDAIAQRRGLLTPCATTKPTVRDLAWAAGFLEGEGCFQAHRNRLMRGQQTIDARVNAVQKQREPLDRLQALFGGKIRAMPMRTSFGTGSIWRWEVSGSRARGVAMTVFGMMSTRRKDQILRALS